MLWPSLLWKIWSLIGTFMNPYKTKFLHGPWVTRFLSPAIFFKASSWWLSNLLIIIILNWSCRFEKNLLFHLKRKMRKWKNYSLFRLYFVDIFHDDDWSFSKMSFDMIIVRYETSLISCWKCFYNCSPCVAQQISCTYENSIMNIEYGLKSYLTYICHITKVWYMHKNKKKISFY